MNMWRSADSAPRDGSKFLVYTVHEEFEIGEYYEIEVPDFQPVEGTDLYRKEIRHPRTGFNCNAFDWWMPFPEPPEPAPEPHADHSNTPEATHE